ncbi:hypothetical protein [Kribbella sp. HUAS MG21]|uniref:Uncharacterized protein n=1 Tax=Kribbella sp. HUAS MG21 TaxID=3160966 RepID=A0AAU7TH65_9ACTN
MSLDRLVDPNSLVYKEVARLYGLARSLRPVTLDRWNGVLVATSSDTLGGFDPKSGALKLSGHRVLPYLTGSLMPGEHRQQAQALATVLHEATHGGMVIDAPSEPNAVRTEHSYGLTEGFAEVRTFVDFDAFADRAGYDGLTLGDPQYPGAFAATRDLMAHVTGPAYSGNALIDDACRGPGVMHFDQFAHAVVANHLTELTHRDHRTQHAVRRELIEPMLHAHWPTLPGASAATGQIVAREIRSDLDAKIDELRRHYRLQVPHVVDGFNRGFDQRSAARQDTLDGLRFLSSQAPPTGTVSRRPQLGHGGRDHAQELRGRPAHLLPRSRE